METTPKRIGKALSHAGVSITVTSLTNVLAFLLNSTSSLPTMKSFGVYAAFGILFDYIFTCTVFAAAMSLDVER